jgi:hypothetical protein
MANNTDPGFTAGGADQRTPGSSAGTSNSEYLHPHPFGDPDQHLYGGTWSAPAAPRLGGGTYQGRHRAVD